MKKGFLDEEITESQREQIKLRLEEARRVADDVRTQDIALRTAICNTEIAIDAMEKWPLNSFAYKIQLALLRRQLRSLQSRFYAIKALKEF